MCRGEALRARESFRERIAHEPSITVLTGVTVEAILGEGWVRAVALRGPDGPFELPVTAVCVRIGTEPNTSWLQGIVDLDGDGFIVVDAHGRTSAPHIFAVGDVANPLYPSISASVGQGMIAAKAISMEWESLTGPSGQRTAE